MLDNIFVSSNNNLELEILFVDIVDDITNFSEHMLVSCILRVNNVCEKNGNIYLGANNTTFSTYDWTDTAKQQYYYNTGIALHPLINEISGKNVVPSDVGFVNDVYNSITTVSKNCILMFYSIVMFVKLMALNGHNIYRIKTNK